MPTAEARLVRLAVPTRDFKLPKHVLAAESGHAHSRTLYGNASIERIARLHETVARKARVALRSCTPCVLGTSRCTVKKAAAHWRCHHVLGTVANQRTSAQHVRGVHGAAKSARACKFAGRSRMQLHAAARAATCSCPCNCPCARHLGISDMAPPPLPGARYTIPLATGARKSCKF